MIYVCKRFVSNKLGLCPIIHFDSMTVLFFVKWSLFSYFFYLCRIIQVVLSLCAIFRASVGCPIFSDIPILLFFLLLIDINRCPVQFDKLHSSIPHSHISKIYFDLFSSSLTAISLSGNYRNFLYSLYQSCAKLLEQIM